jgi:hypothetical protein
MCEYSDKIITTCSTTIYNLIDDTTVDYIKFLRGANLVESLSERYIDLLKKSTTTYAKAQVVDTFNTKLNWLTESIKRD